MLVPMYSHRNGEKSPEDDEEKKQAHVLTPINTRDENNIICFAPLQHFTVQSEEEEQQEEEQEQEQERSSWEVSDGERRRLSTDELIGPGFGQTRRVESVSPQLAPARLFECSLSRWISNPMAVSSSAQGPWFLEEMFPWKTPCWLTWKQQLTLPPEPIRLPPLALSSCLFPPAPVSSIVLPRRRVNPMQTCSCDLFTGPPPPSRWDGCLCSLEPFLPAAQRDPGLSAWAPARALCPLSSPKPPNPESHPSSQAFVRTLSLGLGSAGLLCAPIWGPGASASTPPRLFLERITARYVFACHTRYSGSC
ncbi:unnamed protein product [Pleuronectes platessa]|uniref:Uncharacterized protein n=1 Tax=Pleuronectes platessa TaxID=8262 RepID=A0A9N7YFK2_PLEPL|nr:unnamed protein product [Pleuronectes platessa]